MLKILFKSKILISIWILSIIVLSSLFFFIPYITQMNLSSLVIENSKNSVKQMKLTRDYYLNSIVKDIKSSNSDFVFLAQHISNKKALPLPATIIHDLSEIYSKNMGISFRTYSNYPFRNRTERILDEKQKEVLKNIKQSNGIYVSKDIISNKEVIKVAIADYLNNSSCVKCHNSHPNKTWENNKWKLGDIRGVIEVITPIDKALKQNNNMRDIILLFIFIVFMFLIIFYSYKLIKRENELLKINEILDDKVQEEIRKNRQKEQIMIQKAKQSSMGEMINTIAHQWRQPLNEISSILLNIELRHKMEKLDKNFLEKKLHKGENLLLFMSNTIEDFQNFFNLDKTKKEFSLIKACTETINIINMSLKNSEIKVKINIEKDFLIYGYKNEFSQVLLNLIINAKEALLLNKIKNPHIKISSENKEKLIINIEDNALGIKEEEKNKIFDLYFTSKKEGSGIGLYISKLIIEHHFKGSLAVKNNKEGACFTICLDKHIK